MERTLATVATDGQLLLPANVQSALGLSPGVKVEIVVDDHSIRILPLDQVRLSAEQVSRTIKELQDMFKGEPSLEDEYFRERDQDTW